MVYQIDEKEAKVMVLNSIQTGSAYQKFEEMVRLQKGDLSKIKVSNKTYEIKSNKTGVIKSINALEVGKLSLALGAGKEKIGDKIDYTVGVKLEKLVGDTVKRGDTLATIYYKNKKVDVEVDSLFEIFSK